MRTRRRRSPPDPTGPGQELYPHVVHAAPIHVWAACIDELKVLDFLPATQQASDALPRLTIVVERQLLFAIIASQFTAVSSGFAAGSL